MGRWLARALNAEGLRVVLIDRDAARVQEAAHALGVMGGSDFTLVHEAAAVVLAIPIDSFAGVAQELAPHTHAGQIVFDITSVKAMPVRVMHQYLPNCRVLGTHPVFGPGANGLSGHNVVLTPTSPPEQALAERLKKALEERGGRVALLAPEAHDRAMAVVLGLAHFIAIAAGDTLLGLDDLQALLAVSGVTFRALLTLVVSVLSEDPALYNSIQMNLPALPAIEQGFIKKAGEWADIVHGQDREAFLRRMTALKEKLEALGLDGDEAYQGLYRLWGRRGDRVK